MKSMPDVPDRRRRKSWRKSWPGTLFNGNRGQAHQGNRGQAHCSKPTENAPHPRSSRTIHPQISFAPARFDKQHRFQHLVHATRSHITRPIPTSHQLKTRVSTGSAFSLTVFRCFMSFALLLAAPDRHHSVLPASKCFTRDGFFASVATPACGTQHAQHALVKRNRIEWRFDRAAHLAPPIINRSRRTFDRASPA